MCLLLFAFILNALTKLPIMAKWTQISLEVKHNVFSGKDRENQMAGRKTVWDCEFNFMCVPLSLCVRLFSDYLGLPKKQKTR